MRILPILFNTEMIRAILDGRKTVTRRKIDVDKVLEQLENLLEKETILIRRHVSDASTW